MLLAMVVSVQRRVDADLSGRQLFRTKALFILHNAHVNPLYKPVLQVPAKDNVKGHANVYQGEYAVYPSW